MEDITMNRFIKITSLIILLALCASHKSAHSMQLSINSQKTDRFGNTVHN